MPTYEYVCKYCGHKLEEFQSMSAKPLKKCPHCSKSTLERKIGVGAGIIFKGGGFYETDYRSDSYKKSAESEKKAGEPAKEAASKDAPTKSEGGGEKASKPANETSADKSEGGAKKPSKRKKE